MVSFFSMPPPSERKSESLDGRVALVTGSAKRLGRAVALRLAEEGADVVIHHRASAAEAASAVAEVEKFGGRAPGIAADLSNISDAKRLFAENERNFVRLEIPGNRAAQFLC